MRTLGYATMHSRGHDPEHNGPTQKEAQANRLQQICTRQKVEHTPIPTGHSPKSHYQSLIRVQELSQSPVG